MGETRPVCSFALWVSPRSFSSSWKGLCRRCRWPLRTRDDTRWHQMTPINGDVALKAKSNLLRYKWCFFISHVVKQCETLRNGQLLRTLKDLEKDLESIWTYLDTFPFCTQRISEVSGRLRTADTCRTHVVLGGPAGSQRWWPGRRQRHQQRTRGERPPEMMRHRSWMHPLWKAEQAVGLSKNWGIPKVAS